MNVANTVYDVIKKVAKKQLGFRLKEQEEDQDGRVIKGEGGQKLSPAWDICWHDGGITADYLSKMLPYQKINHYPGMYVVTRKNHLARNLMRMKKAFPSEYNFFPQTWLLPYDSTDFRQQFNGQVNFPYRVANPIKKSDERKSSIEKKRRIRAMTYIVKPEGNS